MELCSIVQILLASLYSRSCHCVVGALASLAFRVMLLYVTAYGHRFPCGLLCSCTVAGSGHRALLWTEKLFGVLTCWLMLHELVGLATFRFFHTLRWSYRLALTRSQTVLVYFVH